MTKITQENWKEYRFSEASRLFLPNSYVQYDRGFTSKDDNNFGKVMRITDSGCVYVAMVQLEESARDCDQSGGWIEYDSKKTKVLDEILRFIPNLREDSKWISKKWEYSYSIAWDSAKKTAEFRRTGHGFHNIGNYNLRPLEFNKKGRIRTNISSCL